MLKARKINSVSLIHLSVINSTLTFSSEYRIQKVNVRTLYAPLIEEVELKVVLQVYQLSL
jgi:hypothetical protein